jgi:hypothetical protein
MQKNTLKKIIEQYKKEIEQLIIGKANLEYRIKALEENLQNLTEELKKELDIFCKNSIDGFDIGSFIDNELLKQKVAKSEIESLLFDLENVTQEITDKNIDKKTMEHLLDEILLKEKIAEEKNEMKVIDAFALYSATAKES